MSEIETRPVPVAAYRHLCDAQVPPLLAQLYAARGIRSRDELDTSLRALLPPAAMRGCQEAATLLADAIEADARLLIVADYDCDGATACAVGMRALRQMGASVHFLVPDRARLGYGLTPPMVALAAAHAPDVLITVDNGIAAHEGIAAARALGMTTIVTDHHLPGDTLPDADIIVNPNQPGCEFASKALAGVGVMFYVMLALRAELRQRGAFAGRDEPNLGDLLDLVALGTVADVVPLDHNNRILVAQGLARINANRLQPGLRALCTIAGREPAAMTARDLGFVLGPRLNAAGRIDDMTIGIECLITDDPARAMNLAQQLDALNRERRQIEGQMQEAAAIDLADIDPEGRHTTCLFRPDWHQGVIGIVAGRLKDRLHRPTIVFAPGNHGELKGSGRSIQGLHLRDALDLVSRRAPDVILRFGGHAMAAGLSIRDTDYARFVTLFEAVVRDMVSPEVLSRRIITDGALDAGWMSLSTQTLLERQVWGQGFAAPLFSDTFAIQRQRLLKDRHLKLELALGGQRYEAIRFNHSDGPDAVVPEGHARLAYRLSCNRYQGVDRLQLLIEHLEPAPLAQQVY